MDLGVPGQSFKVIVDGTYLQVALLSHDVFIALITGIVDKVAQY